MCAIIGWNGKMPTGLLYQLLHAAEHRGRDSTGLAYWDDEHKQNFLVKHAITASLFTKVNAEFINVAQKSIRGIAHTRRASPKMPINNDNAHPFLYESYVFAHNGTVKNWRELQKATVEKLEKLVKDDPKLKGKLVYLKGITTDSMILGPAIEALNFTPAVGALGLVWLYADRVFAFHSKKELTAANVQWNYEGSKENHTVTVVASTWEIIDIALHSLKNVQFDAVESLLNENTLYELKVGEVVDSGPVPVNKANEIDQFTSKVDENVES
jgi:hypothetical protein